MKPPRLARRLLLFVLRDDLAEEVTGDLDEKFYKAVEDQPSIRARINYWYQVLNYIRPFAMRKRTFQSVTHIDMLKNHFTIAWRHLAKHKMYSAINIGGFALGIAACMLLALYIKGELSYDSFYANKDRIYRVVRVAKSEGQDERGVFFPHPFADVLPQDFPEIEKAGQFNAVTMFGAGSAEVRRLDRPDNSYENKLVYMDQGMIDILELEFIAGNPSKALTEPNSVIITEEKAGKYFKGEDAIGKSLIINNDPKRTYTITGVVEDFPNQSHINFDFMMTLEGKVFWEGERTSWCCSNYLEYILIRDGVDVKALEKKLSLIVETYMLPSALEDDPDKGEIEWLKSMHFELQPITDIYLNVASVNDEIRSADSLVIRHGDIRFIWLFGSIAVVILLLACINFINLSTARSASRAKEVGIRKVVGSRRSLLVRQFLTESFLCSLIAIAIAAVATWLLLPSFNNLADTSLSFPWSELWFLPVVILLSIAIGILAGIYPSFYLSAFRPAKVLKGNMGTGNSKTALRSVLVIFQFSISTMLIIGTLVVDRQMDYLLNKELGFDKDQVLILEGTVTLGDQDVTLKNELLQLADVEAVSISGYLPVENATRNGGPHWLDGSSKDLGVTSQQWTVDHDYVKTMALRLVQGRDFSAKITSDSQAIIINEALAQKLNLKDPIGKVIHNYFGTFTVIGVVGDFHFESLRENITPVALMVGKNRKTIAVRVRSTDMTASIEAITGAWKKVSPHQPVRISFLDDKYARAYDDVKRFRSVITVFTTLAIVVACLGLFALSAFMIEQRGKEISIRMVLGAPVSHILRLLSQNFVTLVAISFAVATPAAWYMMNIWLQDYAYKIDITWDVFVITGALALAIALVTIGYQSVRASLTNPVTNLKSE